MSECSWRKTEQTPKLHTVNVLTRARVALMMNFDAMNSFVHVFICLVEIRAHESWAAWSLEVTLGRLEATISRTAPRGSIDEEACCRGIMSFACSV